MKQTPLKILVLAPQPFFQNRGTPIATKLLVEELANIGHHVHLLVFPEGENIVIPGVTIHRSLRLPGIQNIPPSLSWKKIVCDLGMSFSAVKLIRKFDFDIIHAVEESVFIAHLLKRLFGIPYIYDMDSSLPEQIIDKFPATRLGKKIMTAFEGCAVRGSSGVVAVCQALVDIAKSYDAQKNIVRLEDISLLEGEVPNCKENLRTTYNFDGPIMLYVGNLEGYQGIDLLLEGFQQVCKRGTSGNLVIIGGTEQTIEKYQNKAEQLGIANKTWFCGPRPVESLGHYLAQAEILLSPRTQGTNTPMKLYSYLDSGKVILATDRPTHTQVLSPEFSCLVAPEKEAMANGMERLLQSPELCIALGTKGKQVARDNYSLEAFRRKLSTFYNTINTLL